MISCQQYDYVEIACMYNFSIKLVLKTGIEIDGVACDTQRNEKRDECIKLKIGDTEQLVVLDQISRMEAKNSNPHFQVVEFQ